MSGALEFVYDQLTIGIIKFATFNDDKIYSMVDFIRFVDSSSHQFLCTLVDKINTPNERSILVCRSDIINSHFLNYRLSF